MIHFGRFKRTPEFIEWLESLDESVSGLLTALLKKYSKDKMLPNTAGMLRDADGVGEMRFDFGPGYRIYFCRYGGKIILLLLIGGIKKTQRADVETAKVVKSRELRHLESKSGSK